MSDKLCFLALGAVLKMLVFFERIIKKAAAESSCAACVERGALVTAAALFIAAV